jgi:hypothetical protein
VIRVEWGLILALEMRPDKTALIMKMVEVFVFYIRYLPLEPINHRIYANDIHFIGNNDLLART